MTDKAFALSPMSAQPAQPTDADFEAIAAAFMETGRGRWFLGEYAKRNRNADTAAVLDAVAKLNLAIEVRNATPDERAETKNAEFHGSLMVVRRAVETAFGVFSADERVASLRTCVQTVREMTWGLRESGADARVCNLLDAQCEIIDTYCNSADGKTLLANIGAEFDAALARCSKAGPSSADTSQASKPSEAEAIAPIEKSEAVVDPMPSSADVAPAPLGAMSEQLSVIEEKATAMDRDSLGAAIIANRLISATPRSDPLAPIKRMTQAERIAFFT